MRRQGGVEDLTNQLFPRQCWRANDDTIALQVLEVRKFVHWDCAQGCHKQNPGRLMESLGVHRPRNLDWKRAAALLYGDWGTSKAYVIGLAFLAAGYSSLPIIIAVCLVTGLVGYNYIVICKHFPDGGGVYS